jgi:Zn-dependent protease with chaperone function
MTPLPYLVHGATLALAWLLLFNIAATLLVTVFAWRLTNRPNIGSPAFWLGLRLTPAAVSLAFVAFIFLPSYWRYEPRQFVEGFDVSLTTFAALGLAVVGTAIARGVTAWRRAQRRTAHWMRVATPLALPGTRMPAYAIDTDAPIMALVGVLRPRLLITRPVLEAFTDEELRASVAHELGHWRALDNLKRLAMRAAPDLLFASGAARAVERRWAAASEHRADRAVGDSGRARCALASALVKLARLMPPVSSVTEPISALVDGGDITSRVQRLLDEEGRAVAPRSFRWALFTIPATAVAVGYTPLLRTVHFVTEILVNTLP